MSLSQKNLSDTSTHDLLREEMKRRAARTFAPEDVMEAADMLAQPNASIQPLIALIDWAVGALDEAPLGDLFTRLRQHPMLHEGIYLPKHWEPLLYQREARDPRLTLVSKLFVNESDFYLAKGSSADMKQMAAWLTGLANAPWIDGISRIDLSIYYFSGQKGIIQAVTALVEATQPDIITTRIKQDKKAELLRAHLDAKGLLPTHWNPPRGHSSSPAPTEPEEHRARRIQNHVIKDESQWSALLEQTTHEEIFALKLECSRQLHTLGEKLPAWENLRALDIHSVRGFVFDLQTCETLAALFQHARPILVDINEPHLYPYLIAQGVYSRALGSSITLHPYTTRAQLAQIFAPGSEVRVRHLGLSNDMSRRLAGGTVTRMESSIPGYETPPDEPLRLLDLIDVAPKDLMQHLKSLSWALHLEDLPRLDAIFEALPHVEHLEWHVKQWSAHTSTFLQAFAQCTALARVRTCRIRDHWSMYEPDKVKQLDARKRKILDDGEGLPSDAMLISN